MAISINNLEILVAVVDNHCNLTKTSEKLYISQPAISKAIKIIEQELNVILFYRNKKTGMKLTSIGETIVQQARHVIHENNQLYHIAQQENQLISGTLTISAIPFNTYNKIGRCIQEYKKMYPNIKIEYIETMTQQVKQNVKNYVAELGMTIYPFDDFETIDLYDDEMIVISKEPLMDKSIDFKNTQETYLICQSAMDVLQPVLESRNLYNPQQFRILSSPATVRTFVKEGVLKGIVSNSFVDDGECYKAKLNPDISSKACIIYNDYNSLSPAAKAFLEVFMQLN